MRPNWKDIFSRIVRSVGCWVVAGLLVWRGWTCLDPRGPESVLCCLAAFMLMVTGIACGAGADAEAQLEEYR